MLIGCDDYDEVNKNIFKFVHHFMNSAGRLQFFITKVVMVHMLFGISFLGIRYVFVSVNVCVYVGEGLRRSFATPNPFVLTNKICLNQ